MAHSGDSLWTPQYLQKPWGDFDEPQSCEKKIPLMISVGKKQTKQIAGIIA